MRSLDPRSNGAPERLAVYVKGRRDAELTRALLARDGIEADVCGDIEEVCARIEGGAVAALIAEEILTPEAIARLARELERQPPWSDFPIVVFSALGNTAVRGFADAARVLGNVTFLERPVQVRSMLAALHSAIRSRRRQYEARRAIESRDAFLAMLGHELRNPLGAIRLAIAALERKTDERARPKELRVLARQSSHLARLVDELLDVARVTHGKVVLRRVRLDLVEVVRRAFETLEGRAVERDLGYELDVEPDEVWVNGDPQRLEQVFSNLLTNAIKYTPAGGRVRALVRLERGEAVVSVADTGIGIAPEMLDRVFEVFTQIEPSPDRSQGGMGLGLALVERIVALHGGVVEAESAGLGRGSTFRVRLARIGGPAAILAGAPLPAATNGGAAKRVVVVEDNADIRDLVVELLSAAGHAVECAEDGPGGLAKVLSHDPDIAFVDVGLPGYDGLELARRARAAGSTARLVALTGYGQAADKRAAVEAGFDDHLTKPVIDVDLERAIAGLPRASARR